MEKDFVLLTLQNFKEEAKSESKFHSSSANLVFEKLLFSSIQEIKQAYDNSLELPLTIKFLLGLMIVKITQNAPLNSNFGVKYFPTVDYFITTYPNFKSKAIEEYSTGLEIEILNSENETLFEWARCLEKYSKDSDFSECCKIISSKLLQSLYSKISALYEEFSLKSLHEVIELMRFLLRFDEEQTEYVLQELGALLRLVYDEYDIEGVKQQFNISYNHDEFDLIQIYRKFKSFTIDFHVDTFKKINLLKEKVKKLKKTRSSSKVPNPIPSIDFSKISFSNPSPFYTKEFRDGAKVEASRVFYKEEKSIIKQYTNCPSSLLTNIRKEVDILGQLSQKVDQQPLFLRFFGAQLNESSCSIVIEDGGEYNLMEYISLVKKNQKIIPQTTLETWVDQLVRTFSWLFMEGILHRDIKPHNILVQEKNNSLQLKIIDFSVSDKIEGPEDSLNFTQMNLIQGSKGYLAPEVFLAVDAGEKEAHYNIGKADVFSLGLTILQLFTLKDYSGWNNPNLNANFQAEINSICASMWIKNLLKNMLHINPKQRPSFYNCLRFLEGPETMVNY